ncbi:MAG TPA: porin [Polyangia bacterium]
MKKNGGRSTTAPVFAAVTLVVLGITTGNARGAEPESDSDSESRKTPVAEGPALPPSPEQEQRLNALTRAITDAEAQARTAEASAAQQLADERTQRQTLQMRLDAVESSLATVTKRAETAPPTVTTARTGLSLTGFIQADGVVRQSAQDQLNTANAPLNEDRFNIRRARLRAMLEREYVLGAIELDGNTTKGPTARILGAEASIRWPGASTNEPPLIMATIGAFKIPFGFEVLQSDRDRLFMERSTAERALFPGEYDLGARLQGGWRALRYAVAVMNGEPAGETSAFPGRDPNHQKDFVGRVGVDTSIVERLTMAMGVSALSGYGFHAGTPATKPVIIWQDRNQDGMFQSNEVSVAPGVSASPSANFKRQAVGGDLRLAARLLPLGETVAYGELYLAKNLDRAILPADPKAVGRDYTEVGSYLGVTQEICRHGIVGFRYDYYNPDKDSTDIQSAVAVPQSFIYQTFAFTAALQAASGRLIVEYDVNRNHLGRDVNGLPTNLKDNAFIVRGEAKF